MTRALLLLALALAGCAESPDGARVVDTYALRSDVYAAEARMIARMDSIAQADPTTEADYPRLRRHSLTVTNATAHTLLLEQAHVVTLAKPGGTYCVELGGPVTIREEGSYDE